MARRQNLARACLTSAILCAFGAPALAHPHVFAEARMEVVIGDQGVIDELRHVWRFDELFSSTVLVEFDTSANLKLEAEELAEIGKVVRESLAEFDYYTSIVNNGKDVGVVGPDVIHVDFKDGQLLMFFAVRPDGAMPLDGTLSFGVYDPTMYTAIDFLNDSDLVVEGRIEGCKHTVVRPDPDEVLAENEQSLTEAFFENPESNDFSKFFATRLELKCG
ncbi:MAG: DUF1007 family protein [Hyphomicrobiales bacterium]|nr:DUF1007 family protein [Hyphomicrobiales bacterium]MCP5000597.1 DUF1007 family protein [Hyphomicrobiales bacterium]